MQQPPTYLGPALYAADATILATQDAGDRRFWHCTVFGRHLSLWARHVVDDFGTLVPVSGWRE